MLDFVFQVNSTPFSFLPYIMKSGSLYFLEILHFLESLSGSVQVIVHQLQADLKKAWKAEALLCL